ncbi:MAG: CbiQ family ECF transporter T component [Bryobacteraceae bacterium]|nr:CbiQ family ECF transporter T component [Bryobacteraceae bacterium]
MKVLAASAFFIGVGTLTIAWNDPSQAVATAIRSMAATACLILLARTQSAPKWFARISKIPALAPLGDVALLTFRLIRLLEETRRRANRAQDFRLGTASGRARLRSAAYSAAHLFPESVRRAQALERALDCRLAGPTLRVIP